VHHAHVQILALGRVVPDHADAACKRRTVVVDIEGTHEDSYDDLGTGSSCLRMSFTVAFSPSLITTTSSPGATRFT